MADRIVLISDDSDFFEYIRVKLELRRSDELFSFSFDDVIDKLHLFSSSVVIINSEGFQEKTLDLLKLLKGVPCIVTAYNEDDVFVRKCYRAGMFDFMPLLTSDADFRARMIPALTVASLLNRSNHYREMLVSNKIISPNNEVYKDFDSVIERALQDIETKKSKAVFGAISPNERGKFLIQPNVIETAILNNIRKNDILMNYAPNKYFIMLFDSDVKSAEKLWSKISGGISQRLYAGFVPVINCKRQMLIDRALNRLHVVMNNQESASDIESGIDEDPVNFTAFKREYEHNLEKVIAPVFYQVQQKYAGKYAGVVVEQQTTTGGGLFSIRDNFLCLDFRITSPGFSRVNIDITSRKNDGDIDAKRISLEADELETGLLEDLLEQFVQEFRNISKVN